MKHLIGPLACIVATLAMGQPYGQSSRGVVDNELGSIMGTPNEYEWKDLGAYVGAPKSVKYASLAPSAIKVSHGRFHIFKQDDDTTWAWFPYKEFKAYEASEMAAGRQPMFVTATHAGKRRPVYMSWSLALVNGKPTAPAHQWRQLVNVDDDRFIRFWLDRYVRPVLFTGLHNMQNVWIGLDECAFTGGLYGVIDDSGNFVTLSKWDAPFPQSLDEYLTSARNFFFRVKELAPDIKLMPNLGTTARPDYVYEAAPGLMTEDILIIDNYSYTRLKLWNQYQFYTNSAEAGKVLILRSRTPANDTVLSRTAFLTYNLLKNKNTFFAPMVTGSPLAIAPATYEPLHAMLGGPVNSLQSVREPGTPNEGFRLYSRQMEGGIVYVNWTGITKTVALPAGTFYDINGNQVTQLIIPDRTGAVALYAKGQRTQRPGINPRASAGAMSPAVVSINGPAGATVRYTLDGSNPTPTSPAYTAPFHVSSTTVVNAKSFPVSGLGSFNSQATVVADANPPSVEFSMPGAQGRVGTTYAVVHLSRETAVPVTVKYTVRNASSATPVTGSVTFAPGQLTRFFPVNVTGRTGDVTSVDLSAPSLGYVGTQSNFRFTIQ